MNAGSIGKSLSSSPFSLSTTALAAFWSLGTHPCSTPTFCPNCGRRELSRTVVVTTNNADGPSPSRRSASEPEPPPLFSVYREIPPHAKTFLPRRSDRPRGHAPRVLRYLTSKRAAVSRSQPLVIHFSNSAWGPAAGGRDGYGPHAFGERFQQHRTSPAYFRSFGDPRNRCPGRHVGCTEVMAILDTMLMRYDIALESGRWDMPDKQLVVFAAMMPPKGDIKVKVTPRQGWQGN